MTDLKWEIWVVVGIVDDGWVVWCVWMGDGGVGGGIGVLGGERMGEKVEVEEDGWAYLHFVPRSNTNCGPSTMSTISLHHGNGISSWDLNGVNQLWGGYWMPFGVLFGLARDGWFGLWLAGLMMGHFELSCDFSSSRHDVHSQFNFHQNPTTAQLNNSLSWVWFFIDPIERGCWGINLVHCGQLYPKMAVWVIITTSNRSHPGWHCALYGWHGTHLPQRGRNPHKSSHQPHQKSGHDEFRTIYHILGHSPSSSQSIVHDYSEPVNYGWTKGDWMGELVLLNLIIWVDVGINMVHLVMMVDHRVIVIHFIGYI